MTQPIQEPTTGRYISGLDWTASQLARRPSLVPSFDMPFIAAQGFFTCDGSTSPAWNTVYVDVWLNDFDQNLFIQNGSFTQNNGNYFGYDLNPGGQVDGGGEDSYGLWWFNQGPAMYAVSIKYETSDFVATNVGLDLDLLLYLAGTYPAAFDFANPAGTIRFQEGVYISGTGSLEIIRTQVSPFQPNNNNAEIGRLDLSYPNPDSPSNQIWTFDLWVQRLGPVGWTQGANFNCSTVGLNAC